MDTVFKHGSERMVTSLESLLNKNILLLPLATEAAAKQCAHSEYWENQSQAHISTLIIRKPFPLISHILKRMKTEMINVVLPRHSSFLIGGLLLSLFRWNGLPHR